MMKQLMIRSCIFGLVFITLIISSCSKKVNYNILFYVEDGLKIAKDIKVFNSNKNKDFTVEDNTGKLIMKGNFSNGFKQDKWYYNYGNGDTTLNLKLNIINNESIRIVTPENWNIHFKNDMLIASDTLLKRIHGKSVFILNRKQCNSTSFFYSLSYLFELYLDTLYNVKKSALYQINNDVLPSYYFESDILVDGTKYQLLFFSKKIDDKMLDISYLTPNRDKSINKLLFFEILQNLEIDNIRIFSPYKKIDSIDLIAGYPINPC